MRQTPDSIEARTNLGIGLAQESGYDAAVQQYREVLSRDPRNQTAFPDLGLAIYKQGDFTKAYSEFDKLHTLDPTNQQAFYLCGLRSGRSSISAPASNANLTPERGDDCR
ncbi:MAG TPA: hypothetical protein VG225_00260 [Terracidiphilus sp.]|nr:hypothetical protein [Terracidiphilus sp.]